MSFHENQDIKYRLISNSQTQPYKAGHGLGIKLYFRSGCDLKGPGQFYEIRSDMRSGKSISIEEVAFQIIYSRVSTGS